jgi:SNF2 family DNA or RNA helicase
MNLYPYQVTGVAFLKEHAKAILGDEMGLGKSAQAAVTCEQTDSGSVLVVCPAGLREHWARQFKSWAPTAYPRLTISGFEQVHKTGDRWDTVVVDEAHRIKNSEGKRAEQVIKRCRKASRVMLLTGTPIPNGRPIELWSLLDAINATDFRTHSLLAFDEYKKRYCGPKSVCIRPDKMHHPRAWRHTFTGATNLEELNDRLKPYMLRREKAEVLQDLPEKTIQLLELDGMSEDPLIADDYDTAVMLLRSNKIAFREWSEKRHEQGLAKVSAIVEMIEDSDSPKIVIFVHHGDVGTALRDALRKYHPVLVNGLTPLGERQKLVDKFNGSDRRIFIASIQAMGVGFALTSAAHCIFAELDPVPANMDQAAARLHRIGQKRHVLIQHVVQGGTIDARLVKLLLQKQGAIDTALKNMSR